MEDKNYFKELNKIQCETDKKNNLTYISWSDAWAEVKKQHPESNYTIYENAEWFPFWSSDFGIDVKVWVTINDIEHIVRLPVMDWANKAMKAEKYTYTTKYWEKEVQPATQFDINKATQRAFAKAIAMHWVWLYVFRWEDLPELDWEAEFKNCKTLKELQDKYLQSPKTTDLVELKDELKEKLK